MRKYKPAYGPEVDLDKAKTYSHLPKTIKGLRDLMFREIGYALVYMNYFPNRKGLFPTKKRKAMTVRLKKGGKLIDINNVDYHQRLRVEAMIKQFAENERDNLANKRWYQEQVFLFQDEIENMC